MSNNTSDIVFVNCFSQELNCQIVKTMGKRGGVRGGHKASIYGFDFLFHFKLHLSIISIYNSGYSEIVPVFHGDFGSQQY